MEIGLIDPVLTSVRRPSCSGNNTGRSIKERENLGEPTSAGPIWDDGNHLRLLSHNLNCDALERGKPVGGTCTAVPLTSLPPADPLGGLEGREVKSRRP